MVRQLTLQPLSVTSIHFDALMLELLNKPCLLQFGWQRPFCIVLGSTLLVSDSIILCDLGGLRRVVRATAAVVRISESLLWSVSSSLCGQIRSLQNKQISCWNNFDTILINNTGIFMSWEKCTWAKRHIAFGAECFFPH